MKASAWVALLLIGCLCTGCAGMRGSREYEGYRAEIQKLDGKKMSYGQYLGMTAKDVWMDFTDIFRWHVAAGEGIGLDVQATEVLHFGALAVDDLRVGWHDRAFGVWKETRREGGLSWTYYRSYEIEPIYGQEGLFQRPRSFKDFTLRHNREHHWADIGIQGHLVFLGAGAYVSPKETLDFVFSLVNLPVALVRPAFQAVGAEAPQFDFSEDDTPSRIRRKHGQTWIPQADGFEPAEIFNDWMALPY